MELRSFVWKRSAFLNLQKVESAHYVENGRQTLCQVLAQFLFEIFSIIYDCSAYV